MKRRQDDAHYVSASRWFTVMWGLVAVSFALFASLVENLIQAVNIVASIFYGVVLGMFLVAFFLRRVQGTAVFWAAIAAQLLVFALYASLEISYLWYNVIGCGACVGFSLALQAALGPRQFACGSDRVSMTATPVICFGQQPCGFFPRRYLYAKIATARRLQSEIGGEVVFFCHDSDHDPRETQTTLRHRKSGEPIPLNFSFDNKVQRKFSPLVLEAGARRVARKHRAASSPPMSTRAGRRIQRVEAQTSPTSASRCTARMGLLEGLRGVLLAATRCSVARRAMLTILCRCAVRGRDRAGPALRRRLRLHEGGEPVRGCCPISRTPGSRSAPTRDTRLRWMQSVIHCTHYVAGAGEQDYLRKEDAPEITFVYRDTIDRSDEAYCDLDLISGRCWPLVRIPTTSNSVAAGSCPRD